MDQGIVPVFRSIPDTGKGNAIVHDLPEVLVVAVLAILCGMESFVEMEMFGRELEGWLRRFLRQEGGIPSHDTFGDIFAALDVEAFAAAFARWAGTLRGKVPGGVVALDGKTLRASIDAARKKKAVHIVSAWARSNRLVLGQTAAGEKSNEVTAVPRLLGALELSGCVVTLDGLGTQTRNAAEIIEKGADYVPPVKENQRTLHDDIALFFRARRPVPADAAETEEKSHGRLERRTCAISKDAAAWLDPEKRWRGLAGIGMTTPARQKAGPEAGETNVQCAIFSNPAFTAQDVLRIRRAHWGVENSLHWVLDVAYREDQCRVRAGHAAQVFNILRHFTMNLLRQETSAKYGVAAERRRCAISTDYLERVIKLS
jgi:Transposase